MDINFCHRRAPQRGEMGGGVFPLYLRSRQGLDAGPWEVTVELHLPPARGKRRQLAYCMGGRQRESKQPPLHPVGLQTLEHRT